MYSVVGTLNLNGIDVLRWLEEWLRSVRDKRPSADPEDLSPWLPWSWMSRGAQAQLHGAGMTGEIECRYYGARLQRRRNGAAARADRR